MIDLTDWEWNVNPPHDKWVRVLMNHSSGLIEEYVEGIGRLSGNFWTMAPEDHVWGPVVAWRELREGERP